MNALDKDRLNFRAPYSVWEAGRQTYSFKTDFGVVYRMVFADDQTIWENGAYEFCILNENGKPSPGAAKVRDTVMAIVEEFFRCNPNILLYQCETGDNRQAMRERLFLRWFSTYERSGEYIIRVAEIIAEGIPNYAALIIQHDNPRRESILSEFDDFVGFFQHKPQ